MPSRPPSTAEIARAAGVHQTTVSRALRNDHRLSEPTRKRIQKIAEEMGYRPNPLVSALIALRRSRHPPEFNATIAFVTSFQREIDERIQFLLDGAREAAERQGFRVDAFTVGENGLTPQRLDQVLRARNIQGILVSPLPLEVEPINLPWERFCTVVFGYAHNSPAFDRVVYDCYEGMRCIMRECAKRNLHRVGLVLTRQSNERTEHLNEAAYFVEQRADSRFKPIEPLFLQQWNQAEFDTWFRRQNPEVIVTSNALLAQVRTILEGRGLKPGRDIGLVNVNTLPEKNITGLVQDAPSIGAVAARMAIEKIMHNDRGIPEKRQTLLTQGYWHEGATLQTGPAPAPAQTATPAKPRKMRVAV